MEACVGEGVRHFVFSSTAAVCGDAESCREDAALSPVSPFGKSKLMAEAMLRDTAEAQPTPHCVASTPREPILPDGQGRAQDPAA
jgi:UDP-glucose 4-epimerase